MDEDIMKRVLVIMGLLVVVAVLVALCSSWPPAGEMTPTPATIPPSITPSDEPPPSTMSPTETPTPTPSPTQATATATPTSSHTPAVITPTYTATPTPTATPEFWTVQRGDNLSWISEALCGYQDWRWLYAANKNRVKNPSLIFSGQRLIIPWPCR